MSFSATALTNNKFLVEGRDTRGNKGSIIIDGTRWKAVQHTWKQAQAADKFDAVVEKFFSPITRAAEQLHAQATIKPLPGPNVLVIQEGQPGIEAVEERTIILDADSTILRLIYTGQTEHLVWVGQQLVILNPNEPFETREDLEPRYNDSEDLDELLSNLRDLFGEDTSIEVVDLTDAPLGETETAPAEDYVGNHAATTDETPESN